MRNPRLAIWLAWLTTAWLVVTFVLSIVYYVRGIDVVVIGLALIVQIVVLIAWLVYRQLPLWILAGHGLIFIGLALGLVISGPAGQFSGTPWMYLALVPAGVAMIVAAVLHRKPAGIFVH